MNKNSHKKILQLNKNPIYKSNLLGGQIPAEHLQLPEKLDEIQEIIINMNKMVVDYLKTRSDNVGDVQLLQQKIDELYEVYKTNIPKLNDKFRELSKYLTQLGT